jgi:hypothetical protein
MQPVTSKCTISIAVEIRKTPKNDVVLPGVDRCLCRGLSRIVLKATMRFTQPVDCTASTHSDPHPVCKVHEGFVARLMSVCVVQLFEIAQIDEDRRHSA